MKKKDNNKSTGFELVTNAKSGNLPKGKNTDGLSKVAKGEARVVAEQTIKVTDNVKLVQALTVDKKKFKKEYKSDIKELSQKGVSTDQIAKTFDMSTSYANKLLKEPDKK